MLSCVGFSRAAWNIAVLVRYVQVLFLLTLGDYYSTVKVLFLRQLTVIRSIHNGISANSTTSCEIIPRVALALPSDVILFWCSKLSIHLVNGVVQVI